MYLTPLQALLSILMTLLYLNVLGIEALPVPASLPSGYDVQTISARSPCKVDDIDWYPSKFTHPQTEARTTSATNGVMLARMVGLEPAFVARDEQSPSPSLQAHHHHYTIASLNSYFGKYKAWRKKAPAVSERRLALEDRENMV